MNDVFSLKNYAPSRSDLGADELAILKAVHDLKFGVVEVVVHESRITEIRQTRKTRLIGTKPYET